MGKAPMIRDVVSMAKEISMRKILMSAVAIFTMMMLATGSAMAKGGGDKGKNVKGFLGGTTSVTNVTYNGPQPFNITVETYSSGGMNAKPKELGQGTYAIVASQVWDLGAGCDPQAGGVIASDTGTATLTSASDGSTVTGDVAGFTCEIAPFDDTAYSTTLTMTITGGTGRFLGATGSIGISGIQTLNTTTSDFDDRSTLKGKIVTP